MLYFYRYLFLITLFSVFSYKAYALPNTVEKEFLLPYYELKNNQYKCGYINKSGKVKIPFNFLSCGDFKDGFADVETEGGKFSFINTKGSLVTSLKFDQISPFNDGKAIVYEKNKCNYLTKEGVLLSKNYYDSCNDFKYSIALVKKQNKYYFIDKNGELFVDKSFDYALPFIYPNSTIIQLGENKGVLTYWKKLVFDLDYKIYEMNSEGYFIISDKNDKYGYADSFLTPVIKPSFDTVSTINKGYAVVMLNNKFGMINKKGQFILKPEYDELEFFYNSMAYCKKNNKKGFVNWSGQFFEVKNMTNYTPFNEDVASISINNKWGFIDNKGIFFIKPIFDIAYSFQDGFAVVNSNGKWGVINKKGYWIIKNTLEDPPTYLPQSKLFKITQGRLISYFDPVLLKSEK